MKNALKAVSAIALISLLLLAGCSDIFTPEASKSQAGEGIVQIQIGDSAAPRTLVPAATFAAYGVSATSGSNTVVLDPAAGTSKTLKLQPGTWTITVTGYTGSAGSYERTATGSASVAVVAGQTATANIVLNTTADANKTGTFHYSVDFGDIDFADLQSAALTLAAATGIISLDLKDFAYTESTATTNAGDITLASGIYTLNIVLTSGRIVNGSALNIYRKETVYIFPGLTTTGNYVFSDSQLTAYVYLKGTARINDLRSSPTETYTPTEVYVKLNGQPATADTYDSVADYAGIVRSMTVDSVDPYLYNWVIQVPSQTLQKNLTGSLDFSFKATSDLGKEIYTPWGAHLGLTSINGIHGNETATVVLTGNLVELQAATVTDGTITDFPTDVFAGNYAGDNRPIPVTVTATAAGNVVKRGSVYLSTTARPLTFVAVDGADPAVEYYQFSGTVPASSPAILYATVYDPTVVVTFANTSSWEIGTITTAGEVDQYEFAAPLPLQYYYIWLQDANHPESGSYGDMKVSVSGYVLSSSTGVDNAWPLQIRAGSGAGGGIVSITVEGLSSSNIGDYRIGISPASTARPGTVFTPININTWEDGDLATASQEDWYEFTVPAEAASQTYYLWLNNDRSNYGDGSKTAQVNVSVYRSSSTAVTNFPYSTSYTSGQSLSTLYGGDKVYVRVSSNSGSTGTYAIGITPLANTFRPGTAITPLPVNTWVDGNITNGSANDFYAFTAPTAGTYYLWRNQSSTYGGNGAKTGSVYVYRGTNTYTYSTNYYNSGVSFTANAGETVYMRVAPYSTGTYAIAITDSNLNIGTVTLTNGVPVTATISSAYDVDWYEFPVVAGTQYRVYWEETVSGTWFDIDVYPYRLSSGAQLYFSSGSNDSDGGGNNYITTSFTGTVKLRVRNYGGGANTGSYKIVFNTTGVRPSL
ncbi:hypothetical protein AGMMS49991_09840 [Spirochaetia bacterium]|nr:hypothetical protein AGMMS49991_09840 [Spirochaetia bacterium]